MKLELKRTFKLARPQVWLPHWEFKEGQILVTDDEYLIDRLLQLNVAKIIDKEAKEQSSEEKMLPEDENKMIDLSTVDNKMIDIKKTENKTIRGKRRGRPKSKK